MLFQHLFWFYSHPAVYIMVLPAMGVISELVSVFSASRSSDTSSWRYSSMAIAVLGFLVWGHHLFVAGAVGIRRPGVFVPQLLRGDPVGHQGLQLDRDPLQRVDLLCHADALRLRLHRAVHHRRTDGLFVACLGIDVHVTDTYFVIAHFHYIMVGGTIMAYLGGLHYWWPKMTGRMYPGRVGEALGAGHLPRAST